MNSENHPLADVLEPEASLEVVGEPLNTKENLEPEDVEDVFGSCSPEDHIAVFVRIENDIPTEIRIGESAPGKSSDDEREPDSSNNFSELSQQWLDFVLGFFETAPMLGGMADFLQASKAKEEPVAYLSRISTHHSLRESNEGTSKDFTYIVHKRNASVLMRKMDVVYRFQRQVRTYSNSFVLSLIAQYEAMFSDVVKATLKMHPRIYISDDVKISAADVISSGNLSEIKAKIIDNKVDELLRDKHKSQLENLFKKLKIPMPPAELMRDFSEICERRNLITHANGVVNSRYLENLKKDGFEEKNLPELGSALKGGSRYIMTANARVALLGFWIVHSVWRKLLPKEKDESTSHLINAIHDLLVAGYTKMARRLCHFALNNFDEMGATHKAYIIVNLALSYHLEEGIPEKQRVEGIDKSLALRDWSIVNAELSLALCCLREDFGNLERHIDDAVREGLTSNEFLTWVLFKKIRSHPIYAAKMLEHFGVVTEEQDAADNDVDLKSDTSER